MHHGDSRSGVKKQKASVAKENSRLAEQIKEQAEKYEETTRSVYAMLSDHVDIKAYGRASDSYVLKSHLNFFKEIRAHPSTSN